MVGRTIRKKGKITEQNNNMKRKSIRITISLLLIAIIIFVHLSKKTIAEETTIEEPTINSIEFLTLSNKPLNALSTNKTTMINIRIITNFEEGVLKINLKELNPLLINDYVISMNNCNLNTTNNNRECYLRNIPAKPGSSTIKMPYQIIIGGGGPSGEFIKEITIDNTKPELIDLKTETCRHSTISEGTKTCFLTPQKPTLITATINDDQPLDPKNIIFLISSARRLDESYRIMADNCHDGGCYANKTITCDDQEQLVLTLSHDSTDAVGNPFNNDEGSADKAQIIICDNQAPRTINQTLKGEGPLEMPADNGPIRVTIVAKEALTTVTATIDAKMITSDNETTTVDCEQYKESSTDAGSDNHNQVNTFKCDLLINNPIATNDGEYTIILTDSVGNKEIKKYPIKIAHIKSNSTPDFFSAKAIGTMPEIINRVALGLAMDNGLKYPYYLNYEINQLVPNTRIIYQSVDATKCEFDYGNGTYVKDPSFFNNPIAVFYPNANYDRENRLNLEFLNPTNWTSDVIRAKCNLTLIVAKGNEVYANPEEEELSWEIKLRNAKLGDPGMAFVNKIRYEKKNLESGLMGLIGTANKIYATMGQICQLTNVLLKIQQTGLTIETLAMLYPYGLDKAVQGIGSQTWRTAFQITASTYAGKVVAPKKTIKLNNNQVLQGKFRKFCEAVHCSASTGDNAIDKKFSDNIGELLNTNGKGGVFGELLSDAGKNLNVPNIEGSLITSMMSGCLSGVVYNLNKLRVIECGYIYCLKEEAEYGSSTAACDAAKATKTCRFVTGELFELPYVRVIKNLAANINKLLTDPIKLMIAQWYPQTCDEDTVYNDISMKGFTCRFLRTLSVTKDFNYITKSNVLFTYPATDFCAKALCEGDDCDLPTNSLLVKILPGTYNLGDNYRAMYLNNRDKLIKQAKYDEIITAYEEGKNKNNYTKYDELIDNLAKEKNMGEDFVKKIKCTSNDDCKTNEDVRNTFLTKLGNGELMTSVESVKMSREEDSEILDKGFAIDSLKQINDNHFLNNKLSWSENGKLDLSNIDEKNLPSKYKDVMKKLKKYTFCKKKKDNKIYICKKNSGCDDVSGCEEISAVEKRADQILGREETERFYDWVDAIAPIFIQAMEQKGYFEKLSLSGWGTWGRELSANINNLLNPEEWKNNLCNPTNKYEELTGDDSIAYLFQDGHYRPVLTFAAEKLNYENAKGEDKTLYTISLIVISPNYDNNATISLEPGNKIIANETVTNEIMTKTYSLIDDKEYNKICIRFSEPFPTKNTKTFVGRGAGRYEFCREIKENAYNRGSEPSNMNLANEELNFGIENPYEAQNMNNTQSNTGSNIMNFFTPGTHLGPGISLTTT